MTERHEILRLLEAALTAISPTRKQDLIYDARAVALAMTAHSEMALQLQEDIVHARSILGPAAEVSFELTKAGPCYSVGFGSKHAHTMDVHGRGATLADAIADAQRNAACR